MNILPILFVAITASLATPSAFAESKIDILSPTEGSELILNKSNTLDYKANLEGDDDHFFVYLDNQKLQLLRQTKGSYTFEKLALVLGNHEICLKVAYKDHLLTGLQRCVNVKVIPPQRTVNYGNP